MFASRLSKLSLVGACAFALTLSACDSSTTGSVTDTSPTLLPAAAFGMDVESFPNGSGPSVQGDNHNRAALTVGLVNLAVGIHLVIPAAATNAATQATPTVENGTWIWENTVPVNLQNVTFRLEGTPQGSEVDWQMILSSANIGGQLHENFVLYTATSALDGTSSTWSLYYNIEGQGRTRVLDADYDRTGAQHELTFSIPDTNPNEDAHGASVYYMAEGNTREFDYQEPTLGQNHFIEWNAATFVGSITAWNYNNGDRACWDSSLNDVSCVPTL